MLDDGFAAESRRREAVHLADPEHPLPERLAQMHVLAVADELIDAVEDGGQQRTVPRVRLLVEELQQVHQHLDPRRQVRVAVLRNQNEANVIRAGKMAASQAHCAA